MSFDRFDQRLGADHQTHEKAVKAEQKLAAELHKITQSESSSNMDLWVLNRAEHDAAVGHTHNTASDIDKTHQHHSTLTQEVQQKKVALENLHAKVRTSTMISPRPLTQQHHEHEAMRHQRVEHIHHQREGEAAAAVGGAGLAHHEAEKHGHGGQHHLGADAAGAGAGAGIVHHEAKKHHQHEMANTGATPMGAGAGAATGATMGHQQANMPMGSQQANLPMGSQQSGVPMGSQQSGMPMHNQQASMPMHNQQASMPMGNQQGGMPMGNQQAGMGMPAGGMHQGGMQQGGMQQGGMQQGGMQQGGVNPMMGGTHPQQMAMQGNGSLPPGAAQGNRIPPQGMAEGQRASNVVRQM